MEKEYKSLKEFYPFYLTEHQNPTSRALHFIGTALFIIVFIYGIVTYTWWLLPAAVVCAYGFAWVGHFFFEKNKPATFIYPFFSMLSDFMMFYHIITGQLPQKLEDARKKLNV